MPSRTILSVLFATAVCLPAAAQDKPRVDWDAKMLTWELKQLGDPEINALLPDIYRALAAPSDDAAKDSSDAPPVARKTVAPAPTLMSLLNNPSVREEIGMLDSQFAEIQEKNRDLQGKTNEQVFSLLLGAQDNRIDPQVVRERIKEIRESAQREVEKTVLPFQFKRLQQIAYQAEMKRRGVVDVLTKDPLASQLDLTEEQKESLKEAAKEIDEEVAREIARLRAQARDKLFARLRSDQQKKLSELLGDDFDYQEPVWRGKKGAGAGPAKSK